MFSEMNLNAVVPMSNKMFLNYLLGLSGQVIFVPLDDPLGSTTARVLNPALSLGRNIVLNGDFATDTIWSKGTGWTISGGAAHAAAVVVGQLLSQAIPMTVGKTYRITYTISNYIGGSVLVRCGAGTNGATRSANGTYIENLVCSLNTSLTFAPVLPFTGDIDNVIVEELNITANSMTSTVTGAASGQAGFGGVPSFYWDDTLDFINFYSTALNSAFNPDAGTVIIFFKVNSVSLWSDGLRRYNVLIGDGANNFVGLRKSVTNNRYEFDLTFGSVTRQVLINGLSYSGWVMAALTWNKMTDVGAAYLQGVLVGNTAAGLGTWNNNLSSNANLLGSLNTSGGVDWFGWMKYFQLFNRDLTASEIAEIFKNSGI